MNHILNAKSLSLDGKLVENVFDVKISDIGRLVHVPTPLPIACYKLGMVVHTSNIDQALVTSVSIDHVMCMDGCNNLIALWPSEIKKWRRFYDNNWVKATECVFTDTVPQRVLDLIEAAIPDGLLLDYDGYKVEWQRGALYTVDGRLVHNIVTVGILERCKPWPKHSWQRGMQVYLKGKECLILEVNALKVYCDTLAEGQRRISTAELEGCQWKWPNEEKYHA